MTGCPSSNIRQRSRAGAKRLCQRQRARRVDESGAHRSVRPALVSAALAEILVADSTVIRTSRCMRGCRPASFRFLQTGAGRGVSDIANELSLSVKTVSTIPQPHFGKDEFHGERRHHLYALRNGLFSKRRCIVKKFLNA